MMDDLVNIVNHGFNNYFNNLTDLSNVSVEYSITPFSSNNIPYELQFNTMPNNTMPNNTMPNNTMPNNTMPNNVTDISFNQQYNNHTASQ